MTTPSELTQSRAILSGTRNNNSSDRATPLASASRILKIGILANFALTGKARKLSTSMASATFNAKRLLSAQPIPFENNRSLWQMRDIESYCSEQTPYKNLIDYQTMQRSFAGPTGALALKYNFTEIGAIEYEPFCTAWLFADNIVGSAGHCSIENTIDLEWWEEAITGNEVSVSLSFLSCYQETYPQGDSVLTTDVSQDGQLRRCYAFDVVDSKTVLSFNQGEVGNDEPGGFRLNYIDFSMHTLESNAGQLFGTLGIDFSGGAPVYVNHHSEGAPELNSAVVPVDFFEHGNVTSWIVKGDLRPGASGSAFQNAEGLVTGTLSWGNVDACLHNISTHGQENYTQNRVNFDDNIYIRRQKPDENGVRRLFFPTPNRCEVPVAESTFFDHEDCVIGGQTMQNVLDHLPNDLKNILIENAQATPGHWNFTEFNAFMVNCLCNVTSSAPNDMSEVALKKIGANNKLPIILGALGGTVGFTILMLFLYNKYCQTPRTNQASQDMAA